MTSTESPPEPKANRTGLYVGLGVLALALVGIVVFLVGLGDSPDEVDLDTAAEQLTDDTEADQADADGADVAEETPATSTETDGDDGSESAASMAGTWTVDTSIGEFGFADSTGTFVGFRVDEELSGVGAVTAVGRTPGVTGTLILEGDQASAVDIEADMAAITTDDSRRDGKTRSALATDEFPTATFTLTEPIELGGPADSLTEFAGEAVGELTIKGVTNPATFTVEGRLVDDTIVVVGSAPVTFADYGVTAPTAPIVVSVEETGIIEFQLFFSR